MRDWKRTRESMVRQQLESRGIRSDVVLDAMRNVPREQFVLPDFVDLAYADRALPISDGQTISQPYIVALMSELVRPDPDGVVLEIGTGCGYQTAILSKLFRKVVSIEIVESLHRQAKRRLDSIGIGNVELHHGDGWEGCLESSPFEAILVAAAPTQIPPRLIEQLKRGGRIVIPVGEREQLLKVLERHETGLKEIGSYPVAFVPMTGKAQQQIG